jgi:type II secretory pathway component GspD/PulD (secretin)
LHKTGIDYTDQPLSDVVAQLGDEYNIPIHINAVALEEAGIKTDKPLNISVHNLSLRSALRLMLKSLQLTYVIEDEVLCITTAEDAEKTLKICVYDVRRIAGDKGDLRPLIDTISSCVAKETWSKNGKGSAEIRSPKPGLLVITQTQAVHDDIRNLLTKLDEMHRDHQGDAGGASPKAATGGSEEHRAPATPPAPAVPRKAATFAEPAPSEAGAEDPFGG